MIAVTDLASADRFALNAASLRLANRTDYAEPTLEELTRSLAFLKPTVRGRGEAGRSRRR